MRWPQQKEPIKTPLNTVTQRQDPAMSQIGHRPFDFSHKSLVGNSKESTNTSPREVHQYPESGHTQKTPMPDSKSNSKKTFVLPRFCPPYPTLFTPLPALPLPRLELPHLCPCSELRERKDFKVEGSGNFAIRLDCTWKRPRKLWDLLEISLWMRKHS